MAAYTRVLQGTSEPAHVYLDQNSKAWITIDTGWKLLLDQFLLLISSIKNGNNPAKVPVVKAYTMVYDLCQQGCAFSQDLYARLESMLSTWIRNDLLPRYQNGPVLLQFQKAYNEFTLVEKYLCCAFNYLDQFHVKREQCLSIEQLCISCFHTIVFSELKTALMDAIRDETVRFRSLCSVIVKPYDGDLALLAIVLKYVLAVRALPDNPQTLYDDFLFGPVLHGTDQFYGGQYADDLMSKLGTSRYLHRVSNILSEESLFFGYWMLANSCSSILECLQMNLLIKPFSRMFFDEDGFTAMLNNRSIDDLSLIYSLYQAHLPSLDSLATLFQEHVVQKGKSLSMNPDNFIGNAISLRVSELQLIQSAFNNSIRFHRALHDAFEFILEAASNSAQLVCNYLNTLLQDGINPEQISNLVALVCCLRQEKEVFSFHFRNSLSSRLLNSSLDNNGYQAFVGQLHALLGKGFTHQMDVMISDITRQPLLACNIGRISFSGRILTTGSWPKSLVDCGKGLFIPSEVQLGLDDLARLYQRSTVGRRITWINSAADCVLTAHCLRSAPQLHLSSIQAVILLLFNQRESIVIKDLPALTGLALPMVRRGLRHMCTGKNNVLLKDPPQSYSSNDSISVNLKFSTSRRQIRIALAAEASVADHELRKTVATIKEDRKHVIEAYTVKVMKTKKSLNTEELKTQVIERTKNFFPIEDGMLTDIIHDLISREYLCRDSANSNVILYNPE